MNNRMEAQRKMLTSACELMPENIKYFFVKDDEPMVVFGQSSFEKIFHSISDREDKGVLVPRYWNEPNKEEPPMK